MDVNDKPQLIQCEQRVSPIGGGIALGDATLPWQIP